MEIKNSLNFEQFKTDIKAHIPSKEAVLNKLKTTKNELASKSQELVQGTKELANTVLTHVPVGLQPQTLKQNLKDITAQTKVMYATKTSSAKDKLAPVKLKLEETLSKLTGQAKEKYATTASSAKDKLAPAKLKFEQTLSKLKIQAQEKYAATTSLAKETLGIASVQAQSKSQVVVKFIQENPQLAVAGGAFLTAAVVYVSGIFSNQTIEKTTGGEIALFQPPKFSTFPLDQRISDSFWKNERSSFVTNPDSFLSQPFQNKFVRVLKFELPVIVQNTVALQGSPTPTAIESKKEIQKKIVTTFTAEDTKTGLDLAGKVIDKLKQLRNNTKENSSSNWPIISPTTLAAVQPKTGAEIPDQIEPNNPKVDDITLKNASALSEVVKTTFELSQKAANEDLVRVKNQSFFELAKENFLFTTVLTILGLVTIFGKNKV